MCSKAVQPVVPPANTVLVASTFNASAASNKNGSSTLKSFISGSVTGTVTCVLFQPLDLVKTHLQIQPLFLQKSSTNKGHFVKGILMRNCIVSTVANVIYSDSYRGLWRGLSPSLYRTVPGIGMYFCTIHRMKSSIQSPTFLQNMAIGFTARSLVCTVMLPITVIKTRYESGRFNYGSVPQAFHSIWKLEGLKGLFSGWTATIARDAPYSGLYYMFYTQQRMILTEALGRNLDAADNFRCGVIAGLLACIVTQPADVVKTQMQLYPSKYRGSLNCVLNILQQDGMPGLVRGMLPRCLRKSVLSALSWTIFEEIMKLSVRFTNW